MEAVLAQLQWGKDDKGYRVHIAPNSFSLSGLQTTDYLAYLGFSPNGQCPFTSSHRCYCRWATEAFPLSSEVEGVLQFLGLERFSDCPEFDFEECYFRSQPFDEKAEDRVWNPSVEYAHRAFDAHATKFSAAIESMLAANEAI